MLFLIGISFAVIAMGLIVLANAFTRVFNEQFDELMPQRMVDYSGFVEDHDLRA